MGKAINQTIWNSISAYIGVGLGAFNTIILYPWAFEDRPEYMGLMQLLLSYALLVSTFAQVGAPNIMLRYYSAYNKHDKKQLFAFGVMLPVAALLIFTIIYSIWREPLISWFSQDLLVLEYSYVLIPLVLFNVYFEVFTAIAQSYIRTVFPLFLKEVIRRLMTSFLLVLYFFEVVDITGFIVLFTIGYGIQFLLLLSFLFKNNYLNFNWSFTNLDRSQLLDYGLFVFLIAGGNLLIGRIDLIMIGKYDVSALVSVAKYSIAFFMASVINTPNKSLVAIARPLIAKAWEENDMPMILKIYRSSCLNQFLFAGLIFIIIWLNVTEIFSILPENFRGGEVAFLYLGLARVYTMATGANSLIISATNYYRFNLISNVLLISLAIVLNYWLIPIYGIKGAAIATLVSFVVDNSIKMVYIWIKMKIHPGDLRMLIILITLVLFYILGTFLPSSGWAIVDIAYKSSLIGVLFLAVIYKMNLSDEVHQIVKKTLAKIGL